MHQVLEDERIDLGRVHLEQVSGRPALEQLATRVHRLAQVGDVALQRLAGGVGGFVAVELVDEPVSRHHLVGVYEKQREDGALFGPS